MTQAEEGVVFTTESHFKWSIRGEMCPCRGPTRSLSSHGRQSVLDYPTDPDASLLDTILDAAQTQQAHHQHINTVWGQFMEL